jgi:hypothetical protein
VNEKGSDLGSKIYFLNFSNENAKLMQPFIDSEEDQITVGIRLMLVSF